MVNFLLTISCAVLLICILLALYCVSLIAIMGAVLLSGSPIESEYASPEPELTYPKGRLAKLLLSSGALYQLK